MDARVSEIGRERTGAGEEAAGVTAEYPEVLGGMTEAADGDPEASPRTKDVAESEDPRTVIESPAKSRASSTTSLSGVGVWLMQVSG